MRNRTAFDCVFALLLLATVDCALGQETAVAPPADGQQAAQAAYDEAEAAYKEVFKQIEALRSKYQGADAAQREQINAELRPLVDQGRQKMAAWTNAAFELYKVAPNESQEIADLLGGMAQYFAVGGAPQNSAGGNYFGGDQYERALPIIEALVEGGHPEKQLPLWGGFSAVCVGDFDAAEKYLNAAAEAGLLNSDDDYARQAGGYLAKLDTMRKNWEEEQKIRAAEAEADDLPRVKFTTSKGDVVVELFENQAPIATANMISLVKDGFYNDVVFHRVLPQFMAQGGDPQGTGTGGPGYNIKSQFDRPDARKHFRGSLSMANTGQPDTGGSQFFLCFVPTDFLDGRHTAFGRVIEGMEVLGQLQRIDPTAQPPAPKPDKIIKAKVLRDRGHAYEFEKLPER